MIDLDGLEVSARKLEIMMNDDGIDQVAMGRLAKALTFICGKDHPTTAALRLAAESGSEKDIKAARALFIKLKPSERSAALAMTSGS